MASSMAMLEMRNGRTNEADGVSGGECVESDTWSSHLGPTREYATVSEIIAITGISRNTWWKYWRCGVGPRKLKVRGRVLVSLAELREFIEKGV